METFERLESEVRTYCRAFPTVFQTATGTTLVDEGGNEYLDFFAGAGALNYGHNHPVLKASLLEYLAQDGITHSLDMATHAKRAFLETFEQIVLKPRRLDYKIMFPGPTGTNAVEAALKLARLVTGRTNVLAFTNAFHGMTLGSLAVTGNQGKRDGAGVSLGDVTRIPYHRYLGDDVDTISLLEQLLGDASSGVDLPAALILETVQAEGGVNVASHPWLRRLQRVLREHGVLLIIDDIQVGCGRTGPFFSFERAGLEPDIVCLSKSLSGYGTPLAITMMRPDLDVWSPGKHNGTFRGHNLAFVTATAALQTFWKTSALTEHVDQSASIIRSELDALADEFPAQVRGRGMIQGIQFRDEQAAAEISRLCFERGLVIETAGPNDEVLKILPPLVMETQQLRRGLEIVQDSTRDVLGSATIGAKRPTSTGATE